jgi:uncharacterized Zn finger protein
VTPAYDLQKIKYATDAATFQRAIDMYERGKVTHVDEACGNVTAIVRGQSPIVWPSPVAAMPMHLAPATSGSATCCASM